MNLFNALSRLGRHNVWSALRSLICAVQRRWWGLPHEWVTCHPDLQQTLVYGWPGPKRGTRLCGRLAARGGDVEERDFNEAVARLIREARMRAGVTQEYVGRRAGLTRGSITNIESGTQTPPLYRLALIAAAVNAEPADLLPSLHLDEASGLSTRHAADVAAVWAQASKRRGAGGEG
ncbi:helix-turn-helix domain-containing protein [Streptomyces sp. NPDC002176]|uniref:helix-turn-helix domain-containing protein n=1 Tax=Streptomyces sp. NPDC002176 TaxID=3364634 RepID=UPI00384F68CD